MKENNDNSIQVLLIEDSEKDHEEIEKMLLDGKEERYKMTWADRLATGLRTLSDENFDVVLLDLFLPETKGLRTLEKVFERVPHIAVIVLTKLDDEQAGIDAVRTGAQEYLVKNHFDSRSLRRAVRHAKERGLIEAALRKSEKQHRELIHQLQTANKELESFSYSVSHDLRAPLRAITGFSEILNRRFRKEMPDQATHYLDNIILAGIQMGELLDDLLTYSRLGKGSIKYETTHISELFTKIASGLSSQIERKKAKIIFPEDMPTIQTNKSLLHQIFSNLVSNGIKFVSPDTEPLIEVGCTQEADKVIITIADNGIGIPEDQHKRIFNVFQRLHAQEEYPGTGIGLSIVEKALHILHGEISVESTLNQGSVFTIRLPCK